MTLYDQWDEDNPEQDENNCIQCKKCIFKDTTDALYSTDSSEWSSYQKCYCKVFGKDTVLQETDFIIPYLPTLKSDKPIEIITDLTPCAHFQVDHREDSEIIEQTKKAYEEYKKHYLNYYDNKLNGNNCPVEKVPSKESLIWSLVKNNVLS